MSEPEERNLLGHEIIAAAPDAAIGAMLDVPPPAHTLTFQGKPYGHWIASEAGRKGATGQKRSRTSTEKPACRTGNRRGLDLSSAYWFDFDSVGVIVPVLETEPPHESQFSSQLSACGVAC